MAENRWLAPIAHRFLSPELWRFTRRSVPRGVALGMFAAFIVPIGQVFLAAFLALPARANVPLAALLTFVTNPFTLPFWLFVANRIGRFALRLDSTGAAAALSREVESGRWTNYGWFFETAGSHGGRLSASGVVWRGDQLFRIGLDLAPVGGSQAAREAASAPCA